MGNYFGAFFIKPLFGISILVMEYRNSPIFHILYESFDLAVRLFIKGWSVILVISILIVVRAFIKHSFFEFCREVKKTGALNFLATSIAQPLFLLVFFSSMSFFSTMFSGDVTKKGFFLALAIAISSACLLYLLSLFGQYSLIHVLNKKVDTKYFLQFKLTRLSQSIISTLGIIFNLIPSVIYAGVLYLSIENKGYGQGVGFILAFLVLPYIIWVLYLCFRFILQTIRMIRYEGENIHKQPLGCFLQKDI